MILRRAIWRGNQVLRLRPQCARSLATEADIDSVRQDPQNLGASQITRPDDIDSPLDAPSSGVTYVSAVDQRRIDAEALLKDGTKKAYQQQLRSHKRTKQLGTTISPHFEHHKLLTQPPRPSDITLELLLASQSHLGHKTSHWHPGNSQYIFGIRQGIHIISLDVTAAHLRRACRVVRGVAERGGLILFAGTRKGQDRCVVKAAEMSGGYHLFERWTSGGITNRNQILGRCALKAVDQFDRPIESTQKLQDVPALKPDLVVCLNPLENWVLLHECSMQMIPTIGIIDTDANPTWVTYPIPANDDSLRCVQTIAGILGRAGEEGQVRRKEAALNGQIPYEPVNLAAIEGREREASEKKESRKLLNQEEDGLSSGANLSGQHNSRSSFRSRRDDAQRDQRVDDL